MEKIEIGDLVYLTCDTRRQCLMSVSNYAENSVSLIWVDKNNVPQSIIDLHPDCVKKLSV